MNVIRENKGYLAGPERQALDWIVVRIPLWVSPNMLTGLGFAGAFICLVSYLFAATAPAALVLVNLGLFINWFGDSLDGRLARHRDMQRPRFGFFLDHSVDIVSQILFVSGLALSGYMRFELAILGFAAYLIVEVHGLLRTQVTGVYPISTGGVGLTEVRVMFFFVNCAFYFWPPSPIIWEEVRFTYADVLGVYWMLSHLCTFGLSTMSTLRDLSKEDSSPKVVTLPPASNPG